MKKTPVKSKKEKTGILPILTSAYLLVISTFFLLWTGTEGYGAISEAKFKAFAAISGAYIIIFLLVCAELLLIGEAKPKKFRELLAFFTWADLIALVYLFFVWLSALVSPHFPATVIGAGRYDGALTASLFVIVFILVSHTGRTDKLLIGAFASAVTLQNFIALLQLAGKNPLGLYPDGMTYYDAGTLYANAQLGTIGNTDILAAFFCVAIPVFFFLIVKGKGLPRFLLLIPLLSSLAVLAFMHVLLGYAGVLLGTAAVLPFALPKRLRKFAVLFLFALLAAAAVLVFFFDAGSGVLHEVHEILHGRISESFGSGRIRIWREVISRTPSHILLGHGPDTLIFSDIAPFTRTDAETGIVIEAVIDAAHNEYLNILYGSGIFALAAYIGLIISALVSFLGRKEKSPADLAAAGGALSYAVCAIFGISACASTPFFFICLAYLAQSAKK